MGRKRRARGWLQVVVVGCTLGAGTISFGEDIAAGLELSPGRMYNSDSTAPGFALGTGSTELRGEASPFLGGLAALVPLGADETSSEKSSGKSYITGKIGPAWFVDDLEDLGTGFNAEVAVGYQIIPLLALELFSGYIFGEDDSGAEQGKLWGVPVFLNAKLCLPLLIFELYGGVGIGGYYLNFNVPGDSAEDDIVLAGDVLVGLNLDLGPLIIGVEGKYIVAEDAEVYGEDVQLEAFAAMACLGIRF